MKNLLCAAIAAISLGLAALPAYAGDLSGATTSQQQAPYYGGGNN